MVEGGAPRTLSGIERGKRWNAVQSGNVDDGEQRAGTARSTLDFLAPPLRGSFSTFT